MIATIQLGIPVARIELLDEVQMDAVNRFSKLSYPVRRRSSSSSTAPASARSRAGANGGAIAAEHGGRFRSGRPPEDARAAVAGAARRRITRRWRSGRAPRRWTTDACVPISRLADCIVETKTDLDASPLIGTLVGHVGDGNFHALPGRPGLAEEMAEAERLNDRWSRGRSRWAAPARRARRRHRQDAVPAASTGEALDVMRAIKQALDPKGLLNPGKDPLVDCVVARLLGCWVAGCRLFRLFGCSIASVRTELPSLDL